jgi:membrane-associated phospholipid phosphatase
MRTPDCWCNGFWREPRRNEFLHPQRSVELAIRGSPIVRWFFWVHVTNFGDAAVTMPMALVIAGWVFAGNRQLAFKWLMLLGAGALVVGFTKILYAGCGVEITALHFRVISGHAMLSTAVWTVAFAELARGIRPRFSIAGAVVGLSFATLISISRLILHMHYVSEVITGWMLGTLVAGLFLSKIGSVNLKARRPIVIVAAILASILAMSAYGQHAPLQGFISYYSPWLCGR